MKYIRVRNKVTGVDSFILFDEELVHRHVARCVGNTHTAISAGAARRNEHSETWVCNGDSESLGLKSRPDDSDRMTAMIDGGMSAADIQNMAVLAELELEKKFNKNRK